MKTILISVFLVFQTLLSAQNPNPAKSVNDEYANAAKNDHFLYTGSTIACLSNQVDVPESGYLNCLHIGDIQMEMTLDEVETRLGKPYDVMKNEENENRIYVLPASDDLPVPYVVVTYVNDKVDAIQLTGVGTDSNLDFSSLQLGDNIEIVKKRLGSPSGTSEVQDINGIKWTYYPFPISIEFVKDKVYSIRIYNNMKE